MRPEERDKAYLWDMLDAALAIQEFVRDKTYEDYLSNRMLRDAVERHIEIIREAARRRFIHRQSEQKSNSRSERTFSVTALTAFALATIPVIGLSSYSTTRGGVAEHWVLAFGIWIVVFLATFGAAVTGR